MSKKPVGECAKLIRGVSYKKQDAIQSAKEGYIPLLRANNILNNQLIWDELIYVPSEYVSDSQYVRAGNIIITMSSGSKAHVGKVALANKDHFAAFGAFCGKLVCEDINPKYLAFALESRTFRQYIESASKGTNINNLKQSHILSYEIEVPKVCEQERIVSKIEELFSKLDASVAELRTAKEKLKVYRQAVLFKAFQNLADTITMDQIADMIDPQPSHRTPPEVINGIPYIGVGDIDYSVRKVKFGEARKVSPAVLQEHLERYTLHKGDFIMGKIGTIGKPFIVPLPQDYTLSANVILIQPDSEKIVPEFLYWQFSSPLVTQQLTTGAAATSQPAFGIKKARLLSIKMCSVEQQRQIVNEIKGALSICDSIQQTIDTSLQQAEALRQSILKQAFEGTLV